MCRATTWLSHKSSSYRTVQCSMLTARIAFHLMQTTAKVNQPNIP